MMGVLVGGGSEFAHPRNATYRSWWRRMFAWLRGR